MNPEQAKFREPLRALLEPNHLVISGAVLVQQQIGVRNRFMKDANHAARDRALAGLLGNEIL